MITTIDNNILKLAKKITYDAVNNKSISELFDADIFMIEHHDNNIKITIWGDLLEMYKDSKCVSAIKISMCEEKVLVEEIEKQILDFLLECMHQNLSLSYK